MDGMVRRLGHAVGGEKVHGCERQEGARIESARILVRPAAQVEVFELQLPPAHQEIVDDDDAGDRPEQSRVADQPSEDVRPVVGQELPGHDGYIR